MSDTKNIKLGPCYMSFDGKGLGLTKGGVEVQVTTDTYKVTVDQFGDSEVNELITKRSVMVKCPLAETTIDRMLQIMPGATLYDNGTKQDDTVTVSATPAGSTEFSVTINGVKYAYTTAVSGDTEDDVAAAIAAAIDGDSENKVTTDYSTGASFVVTADWSGVSYTIAASAGVVLSAPTAAVVGAKRIDVENGVGTDLLNIAKELRLRPTAVTDDSEDFVIPLAATPGGLNFAYKLNEERIYDIEFIGYPNSNTNVLFTYGNAAAV